MPKERARRSINEGREVVEHPSKARVIAWCLYRLWRENIGIAAALGDHEGRRALANDLNRRSKRAGERASMRGNHSRRAP